MEEKEQKIQKPEENGEVRPEEAEIKEAENTKDVTVASGEEISKVKRETMSSDAEVNLKENLRIRKTEYIRKQLEKQREAEDALLEQMIEEQKVIDELNESIDNNMERTKESRKYNREFQENINAQIYAMHGISEDKLEGMKEYKNAYYQGCAFSLFLLSVVLVILCGILHGFQSEITLFMLAFTGIEGTLLVQEKKRIKALDILCKLLYLLVFPAMMVIFVCYELGYKEYGMLLPYMTVAGILALVIGSASYFLYNPYRMEKKKVRNANDYIRDIEKIAQKEVRKNQKTREKEEKKNQKQSDREEKKAQKQQQQSENQQRREEEKEKKREERKAWWEAKKDAISARLHGEKE